MSIKNERRFQVMFRTLVIALTLSMLACSGQSVTPEPGMEVIGHGRDGEFQATIGIDWSAYSKIQLETATVEFRKNWVRDQKQLNDNIIRERDEVRIKTGASDLLAKVVSRALPDAGYELSGESGPGIMRFTPRIVDLNIVAPDRVSDTISVSLTDSQGNFTLELDIYDSVSNTLLATTRQYQEDPYKGYLERTTSVTNNRAFRLMMERWADWLFEQLDSVRAGESE